MKIAQMYEKHWKMCSQYCTIESHIRKPHCCHCPCHILPLRFDTILRPELDKLKARASLAFWLFGISVSVIAFRISSWFISVACDEFTFVGTLDLHWSFEQGLCTEGEESAEVRRVRREEEIQTLGRTETVSAPGDTLSLLSLRKDFSSLLSLSTLRTPIILFGNALSLAQAEDPQKDCRGVEWAPAKSLELLVLD